MAKRLTGALFVLMIVMAACSGAPDTTDDTGSTSASTVASTTASTESSTSSTTDAVSTTLVVEPDTPAVEFDGGRCPFTAPPGTDPNCGVVTVPQDRSNPAGRSVELAVAVFPATNAELHPPVVYLDGGPGGETLDVLTFAYAQLFEQLNQDRTLIVFDQRGIGYSEPSLACPEVTELGFTLLDQVLDVEESQRLTLEALQPCRDRWAADGVDLRHYNSATSAQDVADIRRALGYDEWDLFGISYGTRLALTIMRDVPEGVRSVILDSTYPPEINGVASIPGSAARALGEMYAVCAADPVCTDAYGDVETLLFDTVQMLNATPADITVTDLFTRDTYDAVVTGDDVLGFVFQALYSESLLVNVPEMLADAQVGRYKHIEDLANLALANQEFLAIGMNFSVQCNEEVAYADPAEVDAASVDFPRLAALVDGAFTQSAYAFEFCPTWGAGSGDPIEADPVESDLPTLVVAGQFDPITPPSFGADVADRLSNATFVEFRGLGHGVAMTEGCPVSISLAFLADPTTPPDTSCAADMPDAVFAVFQDGPIDLDLEEREVDLLGTVTAVTVPVGWEDVGFGAFYRSPGGTDETALLVQGYSDASLAEPLIAQFGGQLAEDGVLDEVAPISVAGREWRRFTETAFGLQIEMAIFSGDGTTIVVALFAEDREVEALFDAVFVPALQSVEVLP